MACGSQLKTYLKVIFPLLSYLHENKLQFISIDNPRFALRIVIATIPTKYFIWKKRTINFGKLKELGKNIVMHTGNTLIHVVGRFIFLKFKSAIVITLLFFQECQWQYSVFPQIYYFKEFHDCPRPFRKNFRFCLYTHNFF